jgi:hypothetical protein
MVDMVYFVINGIYGTDQSVVRLGEWGGLRIEYNHPFVQFFSL